MDIWIEARHRYSEMVAAAEQARRCAETRPYRSERRSVVKAARNSVGNWLIRFGTRLQGIRITTAIEPA
jgi:transposase-like protein